MATNRKAIDASKEIAAPFHVHAADISDLRAEHAKEAARREGLYKIVQAEHQYQIQSIHPPELVSPHKINLSRIEKLFLWYLNGKCTNIDNVGVYWFIEYQLYDYQACVQRLFDGGYLTVAPPAKSLETLPARKLKAILADAGKSVSGTKEQLRKRIGAILSDDEINVLYPHFQTFTCTPDGFAILAQTDAIIYYHQHHMQLGGQIGFDDVEKRAAKYPHLSGMAVVCSLAVVKDKMEFMRSFRALTATQQADVLSAIQRRLST